MSQCSILLVDDHKIMRDGLKAILRQNPEFLVAAEAENGTDAIRLARDLRPHLIVMDISLPGLNGIEATIEILRQQPESRIIILSMYDDPASIAQVVQSGARGFVLKRASDSELLHALHAVARGSSYWGEGIADTLLRRWRNGQSEPPAAPGIKLLTSREQQVMRLVAEGKTSKDIAVLLGLGLQTVRSYRKTVMKKLGVSNVAELTQVAFQAGLLRPNASQARAAGM